MKVKAKNLGALKYAEFSLGDLTIICGENNTGKTYMTYALFGFLHTWRQLFSFEIGKEKSSKLMSEGVIHIKIADYTKNSHNLLKSGCKKYTEQLLNIFASPEGCSRYRELRKSVNGKIVAISWL